MEAGLGELNHLSTPGTEINSIARCTRREAREIPGVAASETGGAQTALRERCGVEGPRGLGDHGSRKVLGKPDREGEIPVSETEKPWERHPEYGGARETLPETGSTTIQG